jgi:hypothetical protein
VSRAEADVDELVAAARYALIVLEASPPIGYAHMWLTDALARVSGAGLTEAGGPPLTLVSPGTPSEPSASPAAETLGGRDVRGVEGHAAQRGKGDCPKADPACVIRSPLVDAGKSAWVEAGNQGSPSKEATIPEHPAGIKPGRTSLAPDAEPLPARPHGGPEDQAGAAAPACRCGHELLDHPPAGGCVAKVADDEWCDCIRWRPRK